MDIKQGMKIRIIADSFKADTHDLPIGSEHIVAGVYEVVKVSDMTKVEREFVKENFGKLVDIPARVYLEGPFGYAVVPFEDVEVIDSSMALPEFFDPMIYFIGYDPDDEELRLTAEDWEWDDDNDDEYDDYDEPDLIKVEMLQDDYFEGYKAGDIFEAEYDEDHDAYIFTDHDGDIRELDEPGQHKYKIL